MPKKKSAAKVETRKRPKKKIAATRKPGPPKVISSKPSETAESTQDKGWPGGDGWDGGD